MQAKGIAWLGIRTDKLAEMVALFEQLMAVTMAERHAGFVRFQLPNKDQIELFAPEVESQAHMTTGPMPEFLVDDVARAQAELETAGIEVLRPVRFWREDYGSVHFRGPDGNVYGLLSGRYYD